MGSRQTQRSAPARQTKITGFQFELSGFEVFLECASELDIFEAFDRTFEQAGKGDYADSETSSFCHWTSKNKCVESKTLVVAGAKYLVYWEGR